RADCCCCRRVITVEIRDLRVFGRHGVHEEERERGQDFVFDVELEVGSAGGAAGSKKQSTTSRSRAPSRQSRTPAGTRCSRRSPRRSPTSSNGASRPSGWWSASASPKSDRPGSKARSA